MLSGALVWTTLASSSYLVSASILLSPIGIPSLHLTLHCVCVQTDTHVAADQTVSSLVAFLAAAQAVGSVQRSSWQKEVVFAAFQGER